MIYSATPGLLYISEKSNTNRSVLTVKCLFSVVFSRRKKPPSLINEIEKAALFHQGSALIFFFLHKRDTPISCLRALGDL